MNLKIPHKYIVIEGNIGSGKTTFCQMVGRQYNAKLILEQFDDNPFLPLFYDDPERYAFTVELFFMTERYKQLQSMLLKRDLFAEFTMADYAFVKTLLFARQNLSGEELRLFQQLFTTLSQPFPKPDLLVYFHRNIDVLLSQIAKRGRSYESGITAEYLTKVQNTYFDYFRNILSFPVLIIDLNTIDFESNERNYNELVHLISKNYNPGVHRVSMLM